MLKTASNKKQSSRDQHINNVLSLKTSMEMNMRGHRQSNVMQQDNLNRRRDSFALCENRSVSKYANRQKMNRGDRQAQLDVIDMESMKHQEQENMDQVCNLARGSKRNSCMEPESAISILKKEARLIEIEDRLGTIQKMSHLEPKVLQNITKEILYDNDYTDPPCHKISNFSMVSVCPSKHKASTNMRKVAKGRPVLYNWVRKYKRQIAQMKLNEEFKGRYQTEILSKNQPACKSHEKKLCKNSCSSKFMTQLNPLHEEIGVRTGYKNGRIRTATFLERLKKLEDKNQAQIKQFQPVFSYNQKFSKERVQKGVQLGCHRKVSEEEWPLRDKVKTQG